MARDIQVQIAKPLPSPDGDPEVMRRTIEQNFEEVFASVARLREQQDTDSFLASAMTDFLFMGDP